MTLHPDVNQANSIQMSQLHSYSCQHKGTFVSTVGIQALFSVAVPQADKELFYYFHLLAL